MTTAIAEKPMAPVEPGAITVHSVTVVTSTARLTRNRATVVATVDGVLRTLKSKGSANGPIHAVCEAFREVVDFRWQRMEFKAQTNGEDAVANMTVFLARNGGLFIGTGHHTNTLHSVAEGIAEALGKMRTHEYQAALRAYRAAQA